MATNSRTDKAIRNTLVTTGCQVCYLIASFVCRTIFTYMLGKEYLGIKGLFTNVLTILSFAELGIGSALVYRLYAPLAENDRPKIRLYIQLYRKVYMIIVSVIALCGIILIPFLGYLVEAPSVKENLILLYGLFLAETIVSYLFVYKKSLLIADQKDYVVSLFTQGFNLIMNVVQIILLITTKNFILYCVAGIVFVLLNNIACSWYVDKRYQFIEEPAVGKLSKEETKGLMTDVKGLLFTKIASTAFDGTDNIFISAFIGIGYVGILSNYTLLLTTVNTLMNKVFGSITASIGNLVVDDDKARTETVLNRIFFLNTAIYGYLCVGMILLIKEFVTGIWLTDEYTLSSFLITLTILELFFRSIHYPIYITRNAMGFFSQYNWIFLVAAIVNIVMDFLFIKPFGIPGLYIATIFCQGCTYLVDIYVVYHLGLRKSMASYLWMVLKWSVFLSLTLTLSYQAVLRISTTGVLGFAFRILAVTLVYGILFLLVYGRCNEWKYFLELGKKMLHRKRK